MKILLLSEPRNPHTIKWANSLSKQGIDVYLFGLSKFDPSQYDKKIHIKSVIIPQKIKSKLRGNLLKLYYIKALPLLRKVIKNFQPDLIHAHYASSYGILGALSGFKPLIITVWGYDIMTFPKVSPLHKFIMKYTLDKSNAITASSKYLAKETSSYTTKNIKVIPFGIDLNKFKPFEVDNLFSDAPIVVGTIKQIEDKYGLDYLIEAFNILKNRLPSINIKLLFVGSGSQELKYKNMVKKLGLEKYVLFTGEVPYNDIVKYHNMIDIPVFVSLAESFGVAIIEAGAAEKAVIVSSVGGLPEVVEDGVTGLIVPPADSSATADAIEKLIKNDKLRNSLGNNARKRVSKLFSWEDNLSQMIKLYEEILF